MGALTAALVVVAGMATLPGMVRAATLAGAVAAAPVPVAEVGDVFDRVVVRVPGSEPLALVAWRDGGWRRGEADAFPAPLEDEGGDVELHLRVRDLGAPGDRVPPPGARFRVQARPATATAGSGGVREGFLVVDDAAIETSLAVDDAARGGSLVVDDAARGGSLVADDAAGEGLLVADDAAWGATTQPFARLSTESFSGPRFSLRFPGGSGFYRELRVAGAEHPLVEAIRMRLVVALFGGALPGLAVERDEEDFAWTVDRLDVGARIARRASRASARALLRRTDPRPQVAYFSADTIEQRVVVDVPAGLLLLAGEVALENGFEVEPATRVLLPGAVRWRRLDEMPDGVRYDWMVLANRGGALLHRLVAEDAAAGAVATSYAKPRDGGATWEVGYRVADVGRSHADDAGVARDFVLRQEVAVLGGPAWARDLVADPRRSAALAAAIEGMPRGWRVEVEPLP